jgi:Alkylmercury lyase
LRQNRVSRTLNHQTDTMQIPVEQRASARRAVLDGLEQLRNAFPLEARLRAAPVAARHAYVRLLNHWLRGTVPPLSFIEDAALKALETLDAIVPGPEGIGCYPFSARGNGISVELPGGTVPAMCAVDALAIARLAGQRVAIQASCSVCATPLRMHVEDNGSLDHDQADLAHVVWLQLKQPGGSCSEALCRNILFLCPDCDAPSNSQRYTLPQATALANAFFAFQRPLLADH